MKMKKAIQVFGLLFVGMVVFAQTSNQGAGIIQELSGTVEIKIPGSQNFVAAKTGDRVTQDTVISTGFKSTALVAIGSTVITVRPLTRLTLSEISASAGTETLNVGLQAGRVRVDVNPPSGTKAATSISSPSATASVRGTGFSFDGRNLNVDHGVVDFAGNRGTSVPVKQGAVSNVTSNGRATAATYTGGGGSNPGLTNQSPPGSDSSSGTGAIRTSPGGNNSSNSGIDVNIKY